MLRKWTAAVTSAALITLSVAASAADAPSTVNKSPLPAGGTATVKKAQSMNDNTTILIIGGVLLIGGAVAVLAGSGNGTSSGTTTSTASP